MTLQKPTPRFQPVIIIGAARSGTNMLRDCLTRFDRIETWDCDEINLIWRHGNRDFPSDELTTAQATAKSARYIRGVFARLAKATDACYVVEKTCANSLRVPFVDALFPDALYLYIVRDGRDAAASAMKRWHAPVDIGYIAKKARYVPVTDIPYYGVRFVLNRVHQLIDQDKRQAYWGPRIYNLEHHAGAYSPAELSARQWAATVAASEAAFQTIDDARVLRLTYERFVAEPAAEMARVFDFLRCSATSEQIQSLVYDVRYRSIGNWKTSLSSEDQWVVQAICQPQLEELGYCDE